jgi:hypothetical protein
MRKSHRDQCRKGRILIGLEPVREAIRLTILTGHIKNIEKPNSLLLIAKPESGKTRILKQFFNTKGVVTLSNATAYGIERDVLPRIDAGEIRHIIFLDLTAPLACKQSTVKAFFSFCNALMEEGFGSASSYVIRRIDAKPVTCGIIAAITGKELRDHRHNWGGLGVRTRFVPLSYRLSDETRKNVFESILRLGYMNDDQVELNIPKQDEEISLSRKYAQAILPSTERIAKSEDAVGFRLQKQLQALMMASALEDGRRRVASRDVDRVLHLMPWINFQENLMD